MSKPTDRIGNPLELGDLVQVDLGDPRVLGRIVSIDDGGIVVPGGQMLRQGAARKEIVTPGKLKVVFDFDLLLPDPKNPVATNMLKVIDPQPEQAKEIKAGRKTGLLQ